MEIFASFLCDLLVSGVKRVFWDFCEGRGEMGVCEKEKREEMAEGAEREFLYGGTIERARFGVGV